MRRGLELFLVVALSLFACPLFAQSLPEIAFDSAPNLLKLPADIYLGEAAGVAQNSKGHMFVFTRSGETQLFEFDQEGNFVREISPRNYAFAFAHTVRVDPQDNVWAVDEGSNMIVKFNPAGKVVMTMGRRPESAEGDVPGGFNFHPMLPGDTPRPAGNYSFSRQTDVAWDATGNIFVSDGYGNARVVKYDKDGRFLKAIGGSVKGKEPGQFNTPHTHHRHGQAGQCVCRRPRKQPHSSLRQRSYLARGLDGHGRSLGHLHYARTQTISVYSSDAVEPHLQNGFGWAHHSENSAPPGSR